MDGLQRSARVAAARIALYGGTFDPVHDGHLAVARELLKLFALDEVLFIPAHVAPHKRRVPPATAFHRYAMLALATQANPRFRLSTIELDEPQKPYTVETVSRLRQQQPDARLLFVMGADSWEEITTWREWEQLLSQVSHVVVTRPGHELGTTHVPEMVRERIVDLRESSPRTNDGGGAADISDEPRIYFTDAVKLDISSTAIRRRFARRADESSEKSIPVPQPVAEYINKYRLYREAHETEANEGGRTRAHD